jgi:hypothetical protein
VVTRERRKSKAGSGLQSFAAPKAALDGIALTQRPDGSLHQRLTA